MTDIAIIVATYNRPEMLKVELESILASAELAKRRGITTQVLVVDDASDTMAAQDITKALGVDYLRLTENGGVARTLATGFYRTDSPFYSFWGDDDFMLPHYIPAHIRKAAEGWDVVAGSFWKANSLLQRKKRVILQPAQFEDLRQGIVAVNDGAVTRREALKGLAWRPERERAMMMTMWLALAAAGRKFTALTEPTWLYRRHDSNLSNHRSAHDNALRQEAIAEYAT